MRRTLLLFVTPAAVLSVLVAGCSSQSASGGGSGIRIGYFQGPAIGPEVLVAGNPDLAKKIDAKIKLTPIGSGVVGLAELRGGAFEFVSTVGNPSVTGAIAQGTKLKVIYAQYFDAAQLIVRPDVKTDADLAGKTIGALVGSSEDFEIRGWLETKGLTDKVKVVTFPSEEAIAAAYKSNRIDAGYVEVPQAMDLKANANGRQVVTAEEIAKLGYASINVLVVTDKYARAHQKVVQQVVCQVMRAQTIASGPDPDKYVVTAAQIVGVPGDQAIAINKLIPWVATSEELSWFEPRSGDVADGQLAKSYALTGKFLVDQGRVKSAPSAKEIFDHLDASYVEQALKDGCDT
jgi:taurine transport system substrate-binding protein